MPIAWHKAKTKTSQLKTAVAPVEPPNSENPSEHRQASSSIMVGPLSKATSSKDQYTLEVSSEDRQPAAGPKTNLSVEGVPKDLPAIGSPSEDQPTTEGPSEDREPAEDLTVIPPPEEAPLKTLPTMESSTTPSQLGSPSIDQPTTEVQAGDWQTAEGPIINLQAEEALEDSSALESLLNDQSTAEGPKIDLPEGQIPKRPTEISQDQSTAERSSENHSMGLPTIMPTVEASRGSGKLSEFGLLDVHMADSDQEPPAMALDNFNIAHVNIQSTPYESGNFGPAQARDVLAVSVATDIPTNQPSSNAVKETGQHIKQEADRQMDKLERSRKRVRSEARKRTVIYLDSEDELEMTPYLSAHQLNSSQTLIKSFQSEPKGQRKLPKRPKLTDTTVVPATPSPDSPESSSKASDGERNGRGKRSSRTRVTRREMNDYMNTEKGWLEPSLSRCRQIRAFATTQDRLMKSLKAGNTDICTIIGQISADKVPRKIRLELGEELKNLEREGRDLKAELHQVLLDVTTEAALMERDLEHWHGKERKFTERIENSH